LKESQVLIYDQIIIRITSYNTDAHWSSTQTLLNLNMDTHWSSTSGCEDTLPSLIHRLTPFGL